MESSWEAMISRDEHTERQLRVDGLLRRASSRA